MRRSVANGTLGIAERSSALSLRTMARMRYRLRARARPPIHHRNTRQSIFDSVRRSLCVQDGGHASAARVAQSSSRQAYGRHLLSIRNSQRQNLFALKFLHIYFFYRRIFLGACQGPLPVVGMPLIWFLLRYLAEPDFYVDWAALCTSSGRGIDFLYILFFRACTIAYGERRARILSVIETQLRHHGLPIPSAGICLAPIALTPPLSPTLGLRCDSPCWPTSSAVCLIPIPSYSHQCCSEDPLVPIPTQCA